MRTETHSGLRTELTHTERGVALLLIRGFAYDVIASRRGTATRTIANQAAEIYRKTRTSSRAELAARIFPVHAVLCCPQDAASVLPELTAQERVVAYWVARGATNKWIAYELGLSESTIASHLRRIKDALCIRRRVHFARALYERGALIGTRPAACKCRNALDASVA